MKKFSISILLFVIVFLTLLPNNASADVGPKESVSLKFAGIESEKYYVTLLSDTESTGPYSADKPGSFSDPADIKADQKFEDYKDKDNFYFLHYLKNCSSNNEFSWGYHPPEKFKIFIYFPDTNRFLCSDQIFSRDAFNSYFTVNISNKTQMTVTNNYNYFKEVMLFLVRVIVTIAVEVLIALLFGLRKRKIIQLIVITNVVTQSALNISLGVINYFAGGLIYLVFLVLLEFLVFVAEAVVYSIRFKKIVAPERIGGWVAPAYALCANAATFGLGLWVALCFPSIVF